MPLKASVFKGAIHGGEGGSDGTGTISVAGEFGCHLIDAGLPE
ncbi:hypothetical protein RISK_002478 [Rhodopirellula islandica]|uniref:Uncharacterized protein n=1 Tax=Rhodopirellula islandica TaxID=595434 RepID=A0A0J1BH39_RHOIS|nr:hypothetical protein RISK_002478 [Rhodopirellula islandica]